MTRGLFGVLKMFLFIVLLPVLIAVVIGFQEEMSSLAGNGEVFWWGVIAYTIFHLFVFTPHDLYRFWQGVFMEICAFAGAAANLIVIAIPIITTIFLLAYYLATVIFHLSWNHEIIIFIVGLTFSLHVILSAQELYEEDESKLKGHYLFNMWALFIVNMLILVLLMDLAFKKFSCVDFGYSAFDAGKHIYERLLSQVGIHW